MPLYRLMLEDHRDVFPASLGHIQAAVRKMAGSSGPTFLNLKDEEGNWAQAGGTDGRYLCDSRDVYGEGFRHFMAAVPGCNDRSRTIVYYRNTCIENRHAHRRCPLEGTAANVLSLSDVLAIMTEYWMTGQRSARYAWDDVSQAWINDENEEKGMIIKVITPRQHEDPGS